jgi:hypothetical protein
VAGQLHPLSDTYREAGAAIRIIRGKFRAALRQILSGDAYGRPL